MSGLQRLIAVVDDDLSVRKSLARMLGAEKFDVDTFASGDEFLESLHKRRPPDFLILDLHMPGLDGFAVQERIVAAGIHLPLVIFTADESEAAHQRALAAGAVAWLRKPIAHQTLVDTINAALA